MIEAALKTSSHPSIHYDVLDVEAGDVREFVNKYGKFDRVYSLLTWHFLKDQLTGYRNVRHLLEDGGECLVSACIESVFLNVWLEVYLVDKWRPFIPDPREIFSDMHYFNCEKSVGVLESEVRKLVTDVGLHCNDCQIYESDWQFADIEEALAKMLSLKCLTME
ncbi:juvenile hormone acid O-methyltransferase [Rhipicephalus sanguineus]|uniref:juvenile hormone acid O-methyltransferase n=1 Tax=Rhipicephalus sanguineus TaxID=34632 RepID=UPI001893D082|nr:juvenile hormone acid O-methyltransferase [Rhipicephalus sanguineus]